MASVLELGGGYGGLGELLLKADARIVYVDVDIPPVAAVATFYLEKVFGVGSVLTYEITREMDIIDIEQISSNCMCAVLCPWQLATSTGGGRPFCELYLLSGNGTGHRSQLHPISATSYALVSPNRNSRQGKPVAERDGELGVLCPVIIDDAIAQFDASDVLGRDSHTSGDSYEGFESEVVCMRRASVGRRP
jgi:hypothetical protein